MKLRHFGRTGWQVSEIGYGMWGMAGWTGSQDAESLASLQRAIDLGCNFFDTAWPMAMATVKSCSAKRCAQILLKNYMSRLKFRRKIVSGHRDVSSRSMYRIRRNMFSSTWKKVCATLEPTRWI